MSGFYKSCSPCLTPNVSLRDAERKQVDGGAYVWVSDGLHQFTLPPQRSPHQEGLAFLRCSVKVLNSLLGTIEISRTLCNRDREVQMKTRITE